MHLYMIQVLQWFNGYSWSSCPLLSQLRTPSSLSPSCLLWCSETSVTGSSCSSSLSGWSCMKRTANWRKPGTRCAGILHRFLHIVVQTGFMPTSFLCLRSGTCFSRGATSSWWWAFSQCTPGSSITTVSLNRWTCSALGGASNPCSTTDLGSESHLVFLNLRTVLKTKCWFMQY